MKKKLISLGVILSLLLSVSNVFANDDKYYNNVFEAVKFLQKLDMINQDYDEATIVTDNVMTNADMASYAVDVFLKGAVSENAYFHDVPQQHWAFGKISALVENGVLQQGNEKMFYPDEIAKKDDLIRLIVSFLGYSAASDSTKSNFINIYADRIHLYKNTKGGSNLTFGDMVVMMYNGLMSETLIVDKIEKADAEYKSSGKTFLEDKYSLYVYRGYLEGYDSVSISSQKIKSKHAVIDGEEYFSDIDLSEYVGYKIKFIYRYENTDDEKTIVLADAENTDDALKLYYYENDVSFDKSTYALKYYVNNGEKAKTAKLSKNVSVIYNGEFIGEDINKILNNRFYSVSLIKKESEDTYSIAVVWAYDNYIVCGFNNEENGFYDKLTGSYVNLADADYVSLFSDDGTSLEYADLNNDDVLSVYKSASGKKIRVVRSTKSVQGVISGVENENDYRIITIDGIRYPSDKKIMGESAVELKYAKADIDEHGFYVDIEYIPDTLQLGYLINMSCEEDKIGGDVTFKILTKNGDIAYIKTAKRVMLDGEVYRNGEKIYDALGKSNCTPQVIAYRLEEDGKMNYLDTPKVGVKETANSLHLNMPADDYVYRSGPGRLGNKMYLNNDTKIFFIPTNPKMADEDRFYVKAKNDISGDKSYYCSSYSTKEKTDFEELILFEDHEWTGNTSFSTAGILVTKIKDVLNSEEVAAKCIEGYKGNSKVEYTCSYDCDLSGLKPGDFITYDLSGKNEINSIITRYSPYSDIKPYSQGVYAEIAVTSGYASSISDTLVKFGKDNGAAFDDLYNLNATPILIYDTTKEKARLASIKEIIPYDVSNDEASFVVMQFHYSNPKVCIIYK